MVTEIPGQHLDMLRNAFNAVCKRARRLKKPTPTLTTEFIEFRDTIVTRITDHFPTNVVVPIPFYRVEVHGVSPVFGPHKLLGGIEHLDGKNLLYGDVPLKYRDTAPVCEHCQTKRRRKKTYLIENESGTVMTVGKSCLKEIMGKEDIVWLVEQAQFWMVIQDLRDRDPLEGYGETFSVGKITGFETMAFLACAFQAVAEQGRYVKSEEDHSTVSMATDIFLDPQRHAMALQNQHDVVVKALEWLAGVDARNVYLWNLKAICGEESISTKHTGIAASLTSAYFRAVAERDRDPGQWVGEVKGRLKDVKVTYQRSMEFEGFYGLTWFHFFTDSEGNELIWKGTVSPRRMSESLGTGGILPGTDVLLTGTVKKHDTYKGRRNTVLNRVKLSPM